MNVTNNSTTSRGLMNYDRSTEYEIEMKNVQSLRGREIKILRRLSWLVESVVGKARGLHECK